MAYALRDIFGRKYPLGMKLQIGSDPGNQVVLLDPQILPLHATLWEQQGSLYLLDNSGGQATFVNQALIQETVALRMGDRVTIGATLFTVDDLNAPVAAPAPAPKKGLGCGRWLLVGVVMAMVELVLLAAAGFFIYQTDVEIRGTINDLQQLASPQSYLASLPKGTDQPGPAILSLSDPWLAGGSTGSFSQHDETTVETASPAGAAIKTNVIYDIIEQTSPEWMFYNLVEENTNDQVIDQFESGIVKGVIYSGTKTCSVSPDPYAGKHGIDGTPNNILTNEFTGHVQRVQTGVTINGVITDRYELRRDNFTSPEAVLDFKSGSLYRARDGGFLVQLEYVVKIKPQSWAINTSDEYSTTEPSLVTFHFDRAYAPEGTLTAKVPKVCAGKVK